MIKELNENNKKKEIQNEIVDYINNGMNNIKNMMNDNVNSNSNNDLFKDSNFTYISINNNNLDKIQNYTGEKMSFIASSDRSNSILINKVNKNIQNEKLIYFENKYCNSQTIINEEEFNEGNNYKNKNIALSNVNNFSNEINKDLKQMPKDIKLFSSSFKKKEESGNHNNISINPSYIQSLKTCHSLNKEHLELPFAINSHLSLKSTIKKEKIFKFIEEINLPKEYAYILLCNGFDDLDVLISQTKKGIALSYQNLKDIGIKLPGERARIIIHLEEISGNFDFNLDKDVIYSNSNKKINSNNSLYKFFHSINDDILFNNFIDAGYYNVELLFIQMHSNQPLNENIMKNDFGLNDIDSKKILDILNDCSGNYINKLKNRDNNNNKYIIFEEKNNIKKCDMCLLF